MNGHLAETEKGQQNHSPQAWPMGQPILSNFNRRRKGLAVEIRFGGGFVFPPYFPRPQKCSFRPN